MSELEFPEGECAKCGTPTFHIDINVCRDCLRLSGSFSPITKNMKVFWNWKIRNDYLSPKEKKALATLIKERLTKNDNGKK